MARLLSGFFCSVGLLVLFSCCLPQSPHLVLSPPPSSTMGRLFGTAPNTSPQNGVGTTSSSALYAGDPRLPTPTNLSATPTDNAIILIWDDVPSLARTG